MTTKHFAFALALLACGCVSAAPESASVSELDTLQADVKRLQDENTLLGLKLQDEIERGTIQVFLMRQEIGAARRETATMQTRCGAPCADTSGR